MRNSGFTLIELIIAITIILIISAISIPGILDYQARQNEEESVNQIINSLRTLQNTSLTRDTYTKFSFANSQLSYCDSLNSQNCKNLTFENDIFTSNNSFEDNYYFDNFGNLLKSEQELIDNDLKIETSNFEIIINKYGGIQKIKK